MEILHLPHLFLYLIIQLGEFKGFPVQNSHVRHLVHALQVVDHVSELLVGLLGVVVVEADDGHARVQVEGEGVQGVVYDQQMAGVAVVEDAQVFHVVAFLGLHARVSIEPEWKVLIFRIEHIQYRISIHLMTSSEHNDLKPLLGVLQQLVQVGAHVDAGHDGLGVLGKQDRDQVIVRLCVRVVHAVDHRLVHVQDQRLSDIGRCEIR